MKQLATVMLAEIMDSPDFAEIMFLVAFILFVIEVVRLAVGRGSAWDFHWILVVAGLACISLGLLALPTGAAP
jgi:hypothetical protein